MIDYHTYRTGPKQDILVMDVYGRLDNDTSEFFLNCVEGAVQQGDKHVILQCSQLEFLSSLGVGTLMRIQSRLKRQGGTVKLAAVKGVVADVLNIVHLDKLLQMYPSVEEAVASFDPA